jgi:divalent metal cation (Fe/Co/Zn/Cd) transporter
MKYRRARSIGSLVTGVILLISGSAGVAMSARFFIKMSADDRKLLARPGVLDNLDRAPNAMGWWMTFGIFAITIALLAGGLRLIEYSRRRANR